MTSSFKFGMLALGVALAAPAAQAMNVAYAVSAIASANAISYELIDLAPDDGIAPQITFLPVSPAIQGAGAASGLNAWYNADGAVEIFAPAEVSNGFLPTNAFSAQSADGKSFFALSSDGISTGAGFTASDIQTELRLFQPLNLMILGANTRVEGGGVNDGVTVQYATSETTGETVYMPASLYTLDADGILNGNRPYFSLSPNTKVVFSMQAQTQADIDMAMLSAYVDQPNFSAEANTSIGISVVRVVPNSSEPLSWSDAMEADAYMRFDSVSIGGGASTQFEGGGVPSVSQSQLLSLSFANDTAEDMLGTLTLGGSVEISMQVSPLAAIPEPSTYALMALGLLGVAGVVRRSQT